MTKQTNVTVEELKERLGSEDFLLGIITRAELARRSGGMFHRKTLANWDSQGKGFKRKLVAEKNGQVSYFLEDVLEFINDYYRVVQKPK